jgi:hypothetical protein
LFSRFASGGSKDFVLFVSRINHGIPMGGLFSTRLKALPAVQVDLEAAEPQGDQERTVCARFQETVIQNSGGLISRFAGYHDAQSLAAAAISNPSTETKSAAWEAVCPNVELQMELFEFAGKIKGSFLELISLAIENLSTDSDAAIFEKMPALTRCLAEAIDLILLIDELKLAAPKLINDLAFFRRNVAAMDTDHKYAELFERSNTATIFWASPTPVLSLVCQTLATEYPASVDVPHQKLLVLLGGVSDVGTSILKYHPPEHEKAIKLCLRCITAATLMFDQVSVTGAFAKPARFHVREGMRTLVTFQPKQVALINAIKYGSKHLSEEGADPKIKELFA